jgi:hypothetical protein
MLKGQSKPRSACKPAPSVGPMAKISYPLFAVIQGGFCHSIATEMSSEEPHVRSVSASIPVASDGWTARRHGHRPALISARSARRRLPGRVSGFRVRTWVA